MTTDPGPTLAAYTVVVDIDVPEGGFDEQGHLNNVAVMRIFERMRRQYMLGGGRLRREMLPAGHVVGIRELVCSYVTEALPEERLRGGCRVLGRSRRAYLFDEVLVATASGDRDDSGDGDGGDGRVVARARVLECLIDRAAGRAVPIPAEFWSHFERIEGRAMPPSTLPFPRTDWSG